MLNARAADWMSLPRGADTGPRMSMAPLQALRVGEQGQIVAADGVLQSTSLGIRPGKHFRVQTIQLMGGPYVLSIDSRLIAVPRELAAKIKVQRTGDACETIVPAAGS